MTTKIHMVIILVLVLFMAYWPRTAEAVGPACYPANSCRGESISDLLVNVSENRVYTNYYSPDLIFPPPAYMPEYVGYDIPITYQLMGMATGAVRGYINAKIYTGEIDAPNTYFLPYTPYGGYGGSGVTMILLSN